ncbi:MAG: hypothetical protein N2V72_00200 [Methanophagales archaeon]|nr:hypothetical protein [Methanophagales archaeon]
MKEAYIRVPTKVGATTAKLTPTTGGPFVIPAGYPDIAWMPTTTSASMGPAILYASTVGAAPHIPDVPSAYTARSFNLKKADKDIGAGAVLVVKYRAVGELVRT